MKIYKDPKAVSEEGTYLFEDEQTSENGTYLNLNGMRFNPKYSNHEVESITPLPEQVVNFEQLFNMALQAKNLQQQITEAQQTIRELK